MTRKINAPVIKDMKQAKLQYSRKLPTIAQFDALEHWLIVLRDTDAKQEWPIFPYSATLQKRYNRLQQDRDGGPSVLITDLPNDKACRVALATLKPEQPAFSILTLSRKLINGHRDFHPTELGIAIVGFSPKQSERVAEAVLAAALAAAADMPDYRSKPEKRGRLALVKLHGVATKHGFRRTFAEDAGNALARYLTALPHNELTPALYRERITRLAGEYGWESQFLGIKQLEEKKAGAFLAVAQGSPHKDGGILHLRYQPAGGASTGGLALVGKGICFDTGGVNLKPHNGMVGMHEDMGGSAVALGTLLALTRFKVRFPVDCWLAICTNHIGPDAYNPGDIITAVDGATIEVVHTDAEGRMVLADTLVLASRAEPGLIIDYATLTGACVYALGKAYSGVFTNRADLLPDLIKAGVDSGERVWPFPMDDDYDEALESKFADIKQCSADPGADHILGARFLKRFVKNDCPWIHMDLSGDNHKGGLAHIPTDTTGFGVRFTLNLLLDKKIIK